MTDFSDMDDGAPVCGICGRFLASAGYVPVGEPSQSVFCSRVCVRAARRRRSMERWKARGRDSSRLTSRLILMGAFLTPHQPPSAVRPAPVHSAAPAPSANQAGLTPLPAGWFGPDWPPQDISVLAALGRDAWLHPLAGPIRRMPRVDSRVFGAVRPGDRAVECRNGHCGVDLGGEIWGEHVRAVHDGVVDWVQRGANPLHGGRFVRISHRGGTVFSQYFHLAAIPRGLERGTVVKGGDVVGLLGDSGVKQSAPHLHFTIAVRPYRGGPERYVDPEPLIALWPLRVPVDGSEIGLVTTVAEPGVPLGSALLRPGSKRKAAQGKRTTGTPSAADSATSDPPALDEPGAEEETTSDGLTSPPAGEE